MGKEERDPLAVEVMQVLKPLLQIGIKFFDFVRGPGIDQCCHSPFGRFATVENLTHTHIELERLCQHCPQRSSLGESVMTVAFVNEFLNSGDPVMVDVVEAKKRIF